MSEGQRIRRLWNGIADADVQGTTDRRGRACPVRLPRQPACPLRATTRVAPTISSRNSTDWGFVPCEFPPRRRRLADVQGTTAVGDGLVPSRCPGGRPVWRGRPQGSPLRISSWNSKGWEFVPCEEATRRARQNRIPHEATTSHCTSVWGGSSSRWCSKTARTGAPICTSCRGSPTKLPTMRAPSWSGNSTSTTM